MILFYQVVIIFTFIGMGYFVFTKYMLSSKFNLINEELENKKLLLAQLVELNADLQQKIVNLEKKSKLSDDEINKIYEEIKRKKNDNESIDINNRINSILGR